MAFSKYRARKLKYTSASINISGEEKAFNLELCENVNAIAFQSHQDRKARQFSNALARLAIRESAKAVGKAAAREGIKHIPGIGAFAGLASTATDLAIDAAANSLEKADLRQWSSLPHSIYYSRIYLNEGEYNLSFVANGTAAVKDYEELIQTEIHPGKIEFAVIRTFDHSGLEAEAVLANLSSSLASTKELTALVSKKRERVPFQENVNNTFGTKRDKFHPTSIEEKWQIREDLPGRYPSIGYKMPAIVLSLYSIPIFVNGKREKLNANEKRRRKLLYKKQSNIPLTASEEKMLQSYEQVIIMCYSKLKSKGKEPETGSRKEKISS